MTRAFDMLTASWAFCSPEDRDAFVAYLRVCGYRIEEPGEHLGGEVDPVSAQGTAQKACSPSEASCAQEAGAVQDRCESTAPTHSNPRPKSSSPVRVKAGDAPPPASPAAPFKALTKAEQIRLIRPHCAHADDLDKCPGSGRRHCRECEPKDAAA